MNKAKKNKSANALKDEKCLCKDFAFTARKLKGSIAKGHQKATK